MALVVGLLAALINIAVLRDRREMTAVAVARGQMESADQVTGDMVSRCWRVGWWRRGRSPLGNRSPLGRWLGR